MNLQQSVLLRTIYNNEEEFSADLARTLEALEVGEFENGVTESNVGTRKADIVAVGEDGTLVVENQFDKADWDHWGRLEAYARFKEATVAVLVAESFEDLMVTTCRLRNNESEINWYLIQVEANSHEEVAFRHIAWPIIDPEVEYSEFWAPIRSGEFGELFAGKPVPVNHDRRIGRQVRRVRLTLNLLNDHCYIQLPFRGADRVERQKKVLALFPDSNYNYECSETPKFAMITFPVLDKGRNHQDDWDEIRKELVDLGTDIYNKIKESDL